MKKTIFRYLVASVASTVAFLIPTIIGAIIAYIIVIIAGVVIKISPLLTLLAIGVMWVSSAVLSPLAAIVVFSKLVKSGRMIPHLVASLVWCTVIVTIYTLGLFEGDHGTPYNLFHLFFSIMTFLISALLIQREKKRPVKLIHTFSDIIFKLSFSAGLIVHFWTGYIAYSRDGLLWAFYALSIPVGAEVWYLLEIWADNSTSTPFSITVVILGVFMLSSLTVTEYAE